MQLKVDYDAEKAYSTAKIDNLTEDYCGMEEVAVIQANEMKKLNQQVMDLKGQLHDAKRIIDSSPSASSVSNLFDTCQGYSDLANFQERELIRLKTKNAKLKFKLNKRRDIIKARDAKVAQLRSKLHGDRDIYRFDWAKSDKSRDERVAYVKGAFVSCGTVPGGLKVDPDDVFIANGYVD
jgi:hypothetical protein